jgi:hypothetical protein
MLTICFIEEVRGLKIIVEARNGKAAGKLFGRMR